MVFQSSWTLSTDQKEVFGLALVPLDLGNNHLEDGWACLFAMGMLQTVGLDFLHGPLLLVAG